MDEFITPRSLAKGRSYVYMLPCRDQDLLKIGFSREPLARFRTLHRRFFDYFDLERGLLVEVDRVAKARAIERDILLRHAEERSPAPLVIPDSAAGYSEWLRGVEPQVSARLHEFAAEEGCAAHALRGWVRQMFETQADRLYDWSLRMLEAAEYEAFNVPAEIASGQAGRALIYAMDACEAVGIDVKAVFPDAVVAWKERVR
jgi:transposase-like protein